VAANPDGNFLAETQVDPTTWRKLVLRAEEVWDDGTIDDINVETLQPPEWLTEHNVRVGASVPMPLDLVEMGLPETLHAQVLAVEPCPPIRCGPGRVVLTTVNHLNNYVLELTMEDSSGWRRTIRPTGFHKFYSLSQQDWISAEQLRTGEQLQGLARAITVRAMRRVPGTHRVYNLTIEGEHVYNVSVLGALTHNQGCNDLVDLTTPERRRHILDGDRTGGGHRAGTGRPGRSEFPTDWSDKKIIHEISDVACLRKRGRVSFC